MKLTISSQSWIDYQGEIYWHLPSQHPLLLLSQFYSTPHYLEAVISFKQLLRITLVFPKQDLNYDSKVAFFFRVLRINNEKHKLKNQITTD